MEIWNRPAWSRLTADEKRQQMPILQKKLPEGFDFVRLDTFERYGQSTETGIFVCEDIEFIFVPGDTVTLGWNTQPAAEDGSAGVRERMLDLLRELGAAPEELEERMQAWVSPIRQAKISPMLVERHYVSAAWTDWPIEELDPQEDADLLDAIETFRISPHHSLESDQAYLIERGAGSLKLYRFDESESFEEWCEANIGVGLDLPSEDEWEYLYGAGCRTLFPWGSEIDLSMRLRHLSPEAAGDYELERPNAFGLQFPGDPYKKEIVHTPTGFTGKGGDGGLNLHGGYGPFAAYLPTAISYRDPFEEELDWTEWLSSLVFRRIVRL